MIAFSFRTRQQAISRFKSEVFDLLIIGGGITGAAVARDAVTRGLRVALVEKKDFAWGTSSRSSKLIHGGLRYLENLEFGLVFEALSERALLLKKDSHLVRPLKFFMPVYRGDPHGKFILSLGLWLYDLLALFRAPGVHQRLSKKKFLKEFPFLKSEGLKGGFSYYDASMWDDLLVVETLRSAVGAGAHVANYVEAVEPLWDGENIVGFRVRDQEGIFETDLEDFEVRAKKTIICAGPWTDCIGNRLVPGWKPWLQPSKGVHLVFSKEKLPVPGAMVMSHPGDGRIVFVIPREEMGNGVVIVGTTDGPTPADPEKAHVEAQDVHYLMGLLTQYFPALKLKPSDILSAYVGVRPLMGDLKGSEGQSQQSNQSLQKISREHYIGHGPGGSVIVAGGKYTTHRKMAEEIVNFAMKGRREEKIKPRTGEPLNPKTEPRKIQAARREAQTQGWNIPGELFSIYGAAALEMVKLRKEVEKSKPLVQEDPPGFALLGEQLRFQIRHGMVIRLEDFFLRRLPLFLARADHGLPWAEALTKIWAEERHLTQDRALRECQQLVLEIERRSAWKEGLKKSVPEFPPPEGSL